MDGASIRPDMPYSNPLLATGTGASARQMTASLIDAGHRRLAMIAPAVPAPTDQSQVDQSQADQSRADQFRDVCDEAAAACLPAARLIEAGADLDRTFFNVFRGTRYPTGILCPDATTADAASRSLRDLGFRVPADVTIVWLNEPAEASLLLG
jgi:DNA-binding LacI/PurR family transcriptional regulator